MVRYFNITGPCRADLHYLSPPEARLPELMGWVEQRLYFVLHAARQTGKTTAMMAFADRLRRAGYAAVWATLEEGQGVEDVERAEPLWIGAVLRSARWQLTPALRPPDPDPILTGAPGGRFGAWLGAWSAALSVPLVLLLDEADTVTGPALVSLLRQLRAGFTERDAGRFPVSVALIGMRDLRDYLAAAKDGDPVNPGSPFNIKKASLTLRNFTEGEVAALYAQHTHETGQVFTPEAAARAWEWTAGQPFLVNALAAIAVEDLAPDRSVAITSATIDEAKERLIRARTTHLDSLAHRLADRRVSGVIRAVLLGDERLDLRDDDFAYTEDLGLVVQTPSGVEIANPLYREVLARELSYNEQHNLPLPWWRWQTDTGGLDMAALVDEFRRWWRENADISEAHAPVGYLEAVPQLAFMGFLQRVVNGGGRIYREYAAGRRAIDLLVEYGADRHVIELKRVRPRDSLERIRADGVTQLGRYLDTLGVAEGWLLVFDQRPGRTWEERMWSEDLAVDGRLLRVRGA